VPNTCMVHLCAMSWTRPRLRPTVCGALPRASRDSCKLPRRWWCGRPQIACMASAACKRLGAQPAYSRACFAGAVRGRERAAAAHRCSLKQGLAVQQRHAALSAQRVPSVCNSWMTCPESASRARSCWRASASSSRRARRFAASSSTCAASRTSCACGPARPPTRPSRRALRLSRGDLPKSCAVVAPCTPCCGGMMKFMSSVQWLGKESFCVTQHVACWSPRPMKRASTPCLGTRGLW